MPLAVARANASKLEAEVRLGGDPALKKQTANLAADTTLGVLANQYLEARRSKWRPKSYTNFQRHLLKYAQPLHRLPITAVSQRNIANLLADLTKASGECTSNRVRSTLCALFSWALKEGIRLPEGNVAAHTNKHEEKSRERVLADAELKAIWDACRDNDFGAIVKLLVLTGQRKTDGSLRWNEVSDEQIALPAERTKNKRAHTIPLSNAARAILNQFNNEGRRCVFGRADTGFGGWNWSKQELDALTAIEPWTLHDLRRTVATRMADLGVQPHIIEAVLNHVSGHKGGIAGVYNRYVRQGETRSTKSLGRAFAGHCRRTRGEGSAAQAGVVS